MKARSLGLAAAQIISRGGKAKVSGITSRGVFLSIDRRVLFVSRERWRGPLTINIDGLLDCAIGDHVRLSHTRLIFPATEVDLSTAEVWQPTRPSSIQSIGEQRAALKQLASSVLARKTPDGFGPLLPHLLDLPEKQALSASEAALLARLNQLRLFLQDHILASSFPHASGGNPAGPPMLNDECQPGCPIQARYGGHDENSRGGHTDVDQLTTILTSLLGLGRGLTPSGDDVTIGLLLMLNRGRRDRDWRELNQRVIDRAYQRTTTISANLIECASDGEADERLINVIDGLATGTPSREECAECILGWGNSSGTDALIGMTLTLNGV